MCGFIIMRKKIITELPRKSSGGGSYALYYILNRNSGIKVCRSRFSKKDIKYDDYRIRNMVSEYVYLKMLQETGMVPKVYRLTWVQRSKLRWSVGIVMKHINGEFFEDEFCEEYEAFEKKFRKAARKCGLYVYDWHEGNVIEGNNGKTYRIDFTSRFIDLIGKKRLFKKMFDEEYDKLIKAFSGGLE